MANVHDLKRLWIVTYHVHDEKGRERYSHATLCATPEIREQTLTEYRATYQDVRVSAWEPKGWD